MTGPLTILLVIGAFVTTWWLTGRVRQYAIARLLDIPTERSSHSVATPRGGGVAIVISSCGVLTAIGFAEWVAWPRIWELVGGGIFVAAIGLADDHRHLSRSWRLLGHLAAAAWAVVWLGALPPLPVFGVTLDFGPAGQLLAALYVAWVLNLTNFMDGIDGIAAVETVTVTLGGALLYAIAIPGARDWTTLLAVGAATLGFLVWNWPPARIFMGDVGSGFLGFVLAMFSLQAGLSKAELFWGWVILLGVFVADATVTLIRRALRGERFYESHRTHAYQHAATRCGAHRPVTLAVAVINLAWLLPIAALVARGSLDGAAGALIAYTPLVACALWFDAGVDRPSIRHAAERQVV